MYLGCLDDFPYSKGQREVNFDACVCMGTRVCVWGGGGGALVCVYALVRVCRVRTELENLEKYLNFENRFQGLEKALKIPKNEEYS